MFEQQVQQPAQLADGTQQVVSTTPEQASQQGTVQGDQQQLQSTQQTQGTHQEQQAAAEQGVTVEQYRSLQGDYTRTRQELASLTQRYNATLESMIRQQQSQQQVQKQPTIWDLDDAALTQKLNSAPASTLRQLIESVAEELADKKVSSIRSELTATQMVVNTQRVNEALSTLSTKYSHLPIYNEVLRRAVDYMTGPGLEQSKADPSGTLENMFRFELYKEVEKNPALFSQLQQANANYQQQVTTGKQMAAPMSTSSNVNQMPHQPMNGVNHQQQLSAQQVARQISTFDEYEYQGQRPFQATFNEL
jgi:hypothetical protein